MRQYGQFCPLAKALDVVGDRWTLLIVRELAVRPCRYTDLRDGLPGIATNLLAARLKSLEAADVITAGPATAAALLRGQLHPDAAAREGRAQINGTRTARARLARLIDASRVTQQRMVRGR